MIDSHDKKNLLRMWRERHNLKATSALIRILRSHARSYKFNPTHREAIALEALAGMICARDQKLADLVLDLLPKKDLHIKK